MKISRLYMRNFKRFKEIEIEITNGLTKDILDRFVILGYNGTGKTTILQAIALCLSMASGKIRSISQFNWLGWVPGRYEKWGEPLIELEVHLTDEEIKATIEVAKKWKDFGNLPKFVLPGESRKLVLRLKGNWCEIINEEGKKTKASIYQLKGRYYATQLIKTSPWARDYFQKLPGFFGFDQYRNLAIPIIDEIKKGQESIYSDNAEKVDITGQVTYSVGVSRLRRYLNTWRMNQVAGVDGGKDWLLDLENSYKRIFPEHSFFGLEFMHKDGVPAPTDYYFTLSDGNKSYDIEEMSAGEQSVFPMLFEFVRLQIGNSVVLIDEIDLNLHPPLAQALLNALPTLGPNCQFLLTTHSEAITSICSPYEIYRLEGGKLCL